MKKRGIHIFRRDLRLEDNTALNALAHEVDEIVPVFILDPRQTSEHPYRSTPGLQILVESLEELDQTFRERGSELHLRVGNAEEVVAALLSELQPHAISFNKDYTPFACERDALIEKCAASHGILCIARDDATLFAPGTIVSKEGKPYSVYTHYRLGVEGRKVPEPVALPASPAFISCEGGSSVKEALDSVVLTRRLLRVRGGRTAALSRLHTLQHMRHYTTERDMPAIEGTSLLSAAIKFGTVSIREAYHYARTHMPQPETFLREILWHDFFTTVAALTPHVHQGAYRKEFNGIRWNDDEALFARWKDGTTGFPIVDAGMRELLQTGYMHNRVRMITASFLVKDLHMNWQWGEKHFAQHLSDYDPAVNNGNWQWVAGTGCDAAPWFRIFNPWLQQKKFDPDCVYIKKWIPELASCSSAEIHDEYGEERINRGYPEPILNHREAAAQTKAMYQTVLERHTEY